LRQTCTKGCKGINLVLAEVILQWQPVPSATSNINETAAWQQLQDVRVWRRVWKNAQSCIQQSCNACLHSLWHELAGAHSICQVLLYLLQPLLVMNHGGLFTKASSFSAPRAAAASSIAC
jgi:hypothetical protein